MLELVVCLKTICQLAPFKKKGGGMMNLRASCMGLLQTLSAGKDTVTAGL